MALFAKIFDFLKRKKRRKIRIICTGKVKKVNELLTINVTQILFVQEVISYKAKHKMCLL
jgi:hypothetical protein